MQSVPPVTPPRVAVLADDLTSAGDGAAPFRRGGHPARVLLSGSPLAGHGREGGVLAVDLGGRLLDEAGAEARTREAARALSGAGLLLKTVDSTLRGHVAAEIRAAREGSGRRAVVVAPAFPAEGRTTRDGVQYVREVRVDESEFARDPAHPVRTADLARLLPEAVRVDAARPELLTERVPSGGLFVCSAATDADRDRIVAAVPDHGAVLWVGSPGLAAALARHHALPGGGADTGELPPAARPLVVVGSANPATRRQLALLAGRPGAVAAVAAAPLETATDALVRIIHTPHERRADPAELPRELAASVAALAARAPFDGLVLTGGETAEAVLRALGAHGIDLHDEPEPGIARGTLAGPAGVPRVPVVVKAGGFGDDRTLLRLHALLTGAGPA
ncbi:four-carbon acid sugar kinase family protein [Streptomyces roseolus]|uniref:four-carbon acid sugar kinase family protein n=1 Tax=Streptomyces roseolus TaxID=67358 RepID=UPI001671EA7F|nr:four-carbon acid sugar kinase family protein [Streptomyces roseolus]GGR58443.1 membrane protein [Streptomyces roseolus]